MFFLSDFGIRKCRNVKWEPNEKREEEKKNATRNNEKKMKRKKKTNCSIENSITTQCVEHTHIVHRTLERKREITVTQSEYNTC